METRCKMTLKKFKAIGTYEDPSYLTFNYEENLFDHIRSKIFSSYEATYSSLTKGQKVIWDYFCLSSQIRNGGITQYYWNYEGYFIDEFDLMLKIINDPKFTELVNISKNIYIENKYLVSNYKHLTEQKNPKLNYYGLWSNIIKGDELNQYFFANQT